MAVTISPNMNLVVPGVGTELGPAWANDLNASLSIVDQHNHSSGSGVQIQPSGLNINSALTFQNSPATNLQASVYTAQASLATLQAVYVKGVDLYYNDGSSNVIQITSGGNVNATSSGITSGTNSASFVSNVLVVLAAATTPADIKGGSLLLGNNVANSKFLTLSPPTAMAANYALTLPASTASTKIMTLDSSGNMAASYTVDNTTIEIATNVIGVKAGGIGTTQLANGSVTRAKEAAVGQQVASSSGTYSTSSSSFQVVDNQSVPITVTGRPVIISLISDGSSVGAGIGVLDNSTDGVLLATFAIFRGVTQIATYSYVQEGKMSILSVIPSSSISYVDVPAAGTYTYSLQVLTPIATNIVTVNLCRLMIYEL